MKPKLTFVRNYYGQGIRNDSPQLIISELLFYDDHTKLYLSLPCASGLAGHQGDNSWERGKAWLPLSDEIVGTYKVSTHEEYHEKLKGFGFHITPDPVLCADDPTTLRSELFIHEDLGVPGSEGCPAIQKLDPKLSVFPIFRAAMKAYYDAGIHEIELEVRK